MADGTKIEWTDATWNPITGCSVVSPGCTNCYAMKLAGTRLKNHPTRAGLTIDSKAGPVWNGQVRFNEGMLLDPMKWRRPRMIFVCAHGDLFAENVPDEWIDQVFAVMALAPHHIFQVLTKRPERMTTYLTNPHTATRIYDLVMDMVVIDGAKAILTTPRTHDVAPDGNKVMLGLWPLPNVWLGVSVEDQKRADERQLPMVALAISGWLTWVSYEPALGPVDWASNGGWGFLHWLVSGGESGHGARPTHPDWHRAARDFCSAHDIAFLFKQWGEYLPAIDRDRDDPDWRRDYSHTYADDQPDMAWLNIDGGCGFHGARFHVMQRVGKRVAGRLLDGVEHNAFPSTPQQEEA